VAGPVSLEQARTLLRGALPAPAAEGPTEVVALASALGRVLAADVPCPGDLPPFDRSLVDGYAVRCGDGPRLRLAGEVRMGQVAPSLPSGAAVYVPTGGMVPSGADAVVMKEEVAVADGWVHLRRPASPGDNVLRRGADARAGEVALPAGRRLRPSEIALLATVGVERVPVYPRPRIAVLSTGDELVPAGAARGPAQVPDSNGPALCAALVRDGAEPRFLGIVPDERPAVVRALDRALRDHAALLCTGGSSVGERDFVQDALREVLGVPPLFGAVAIRPGRPTAAFVAGGRWAVALPGHAVSALVVYELLVREAVLRWGGETEPRPRGWAEAVLAEGVHAPADRDLYVRVRLEEGRAVPLRGASAAVGNLARADGLLPCPAGRALEPGERVRVLLLD
jgi:molybdopterin molybdotransferase